MGKLMIKDRFGWSGSFLNISLHRISAESLGQVMRRKNNEN